MICKKKIEIFFDDAYQLKIPLKAVACWAEVAERLLSHPPEPAALTNRTLFAFLRHFSRKRFDVLPEKQSRKSIFKNFQCLMS